MDHKQPDRHPEQKGIFIVFCIILLPTMILILTLIIDLGFLFIASRQAQNLSDMIASASTNLLLKDDPNDVTTVKFWGWQSIKPTAKGLAMRVGVKGAPQPNNDNDWFDDGVTTYNDKPDYDSDTMVVTAPGGQTLSIKVRRELRCYLPSGEEKTLDLEPYQDYWCLANMARVNVSVSGLSPFFAKYMGVTTLSSLNREAIGHVRPFPLSCGQPSCTYYEPYINIYTNPMAPVATPGCPTPTGTPTPVVTVPTTATPTATFIPPTATPTPAAPTPTNTIAVPTATNTSVPPTPTNTFPPPPSTFTPTRTPTPFGPGTPVGPPTFGPPATFNPGGFGLPSFD